MPCSDGGYYDRIYDEDRRRDLGEREAMLCAALTVLKANNLLNKINYKEAGVTKKALEEWWAGHQRQDAMRRAEERRRAEQKRTKEEALKKLTPAERKALGL